MQIYYSDPVHKGVYRARDLWLYGLDSSAKTRHS
jgi:hypothetical protein